jgi:nicotinamide riboside transporter PnuC
MMFGFGFYDVFIIAGILGVQHVLSTRNSVYWGGLIPLAFVTWHTWVLFNENEKFLAYVLILLIGLAFLIGGWYEGRKALQKKRKQELDKIKSSDMK